MLKKSLSILLALMMCATCSCAVKTANENEVPVSPMVSSEKATQSITDMAGRQIEIPTDIEKVYSTGQPGVVMLYTLCPDKLLGWCIKPSDNEKAYIRPKYLALPVLGLMQGSNDTVSKEEIIGRKPDIIILVTEINDETVSDAEEIQANMDIPVVVIDYDLDSLQKSYEFLGGLMHETDRAQALGNYCAQTIEEAKAIAATIPDSERLSVYYAQGSKGLQTAPLGSSHSEVLDLVVGKNVVKLEADSDGRVSVNMEQVLIWNPDVVIASNSMDHTGTKVDGSNVRSVIDNASDVWNQVKAVQDKMVFTVPCLPYNWLDMPPSANRVIGIKWLGNLLYPAYFKYDIRKETREFYDLFYQVALTDEQLDSLLINAQR